MWFEFHRDVLANIARENGREVVAVGGTVISFNVEVVFACEAADTNEAGTRFTIEPVGVAGDKVVELYRVVYFKSKDGASLASNS